MKRGITAEEAIARILAVCEEMDASVVWSSSHVGFTPLEPDADDQVGKTFSLSIEYGKRADGAAGE